MVFTQKKKIEILRVMLLFIFVQLLDLPRQLDSPVAMCDGCSFMYTDRFPLVLFCIFSQFSHSLGQVAAWQWCIILNELNFDTWHH